jgi:hypothetical protein
MARIPMGEFGQLTPSARPTPTASAAQLDGGLSDAVQRVGNTAAAIGQNTIDQQAAEQLRLQRQAEAEARQEAEKQANRADQVAQLNAHADIQVGLADLNDEITAGLSTGALNKDDARKQWTERSTKLLGDSIGKLPTDLAPLVQAQMKPLAGNLTNRLEDTIRKRDQQDADAGLITYKEQLQRLANTDMEGAIKQWDQTVRALGPGAGWTPEKVEKEAQGFKEQVTFTKAYEMVSGARNDRKSLDTAEKTIQGMNDMDPQKRATLLDRVGAYKYSLDQKAELAAQRAQRQNEATMKRAEVTFQTFQAVSDKGLALDPAYVDTVVKATAGTPYQAGVIAMAKAAAENGGLAAQPIPAQRAELDRITAQIAKEGNSPTLSKRKDQIEKVLRGSQTDIKEDPMRAYLDRSTDAANFTPLDTSNLQNLTKSLSDRSAIAARASEWSGGPVAPLTGEEIEPVRKMLDALPAGQRSAAIATLATTLGPQAAAGMARQLDKKDRALGLAFGMAGSQTTQGRYVSELVLKGAQAEKDGTSTKNKDAADVKPGQWKRFMTAELENVYPTQTMTEGVRDAALYIAHGIAAENGGKLGEDDMKRAVRLAAGGDLVNHNGRTIPLPAGVDTDMLEKRLRSITPEEITQQSAQGTVKVAGVDMAAADFVKSLPGAELSYAGPRRFNVIVGGRPVTAADGKRRITIEVK